MYLIYQSDIPLDLTIINLTIIGLFFTDLFDWIHTDTHMSDMWILCPHSSEIDSTSENTQWRETTQMSVLSLRSDSTGPSQTTHTEHTHETGSCITKQLRAMNYVSVNCWY